MFNHNTAVNCRKQVLRLQWEHYLMPTVFWKQKWLANRGDGGSHIAQASTLSDSIHSSCRLGKMYTPCRPLEEIKDYRLLTHLRLIHIDASRCTGIALI